jgi:DNA-binding XRE family transcriptional regulator
MARNIDDIIKALPPKRQKRVLARADALAADMVRHADSLKQLRKAVGKTQTEVAEKLGMKQNAISQLESRTDLYVSTLGKYVKALGHKLELSLVTANGERVELPNFHPWEQPSTPTVTRSRVRGSSRKAV